MRFLLKITPTTSEVASSISQSLRSVVGGAQATKLGDVRRKETALWGQQCSPNCGCALRFETEIDIVNQNRITSASYHAKTIITTSKSRNGSTTLQPLLTQNSGRPIIKECSCNTLHVLAKSITEKLPRLTLSQAQNQLEFSGVRSSRAFRHSVLKDYKLLSKKGQNTTTEASTIERRKHERAGQCFDLVEEALVACLKQHMLRPRQDNTVKVRQNRSRSTTKDVNPLRFVQAAKKRSAILYGASEKQRNEKLSLNDHTSIPPFHLLNETNPMSDESEMRITHESMRDDSNSKHIIDWVSYVDEMRQVQE